MKIKNLLPVQILILELCKPNISIFFLVGVLFLMTEVSGQSITDKSYDCGMEEFPEPELSEFESMECDLDTVNFKCVRIKFHYLNNTTDSSLAPSDEYYYDLLDKINAEFYPGKIKFTFDYNCIHREDLSSNLITLIQDQFDVLELAEDTLYDDDFEEDINSINVYTLQKVFPISINQPMVYQFGAEFFKRAIVPFDSFGVIIHELGHTLGLEHTFRGSGFNPLNPAPMEDLKLCKDPNELNFAGMKYCTLTHDFICDTGLDPWTLDIGTSSMKDSIKDFGKWVNQQTCTQRPELLAEYTDGCLDSITAWNIPVNNYMSYYRRCRKEFTEGQYCYCHMNLEKIENSMLLVNCDLDPYAIVAPDITINSPINWVDSTYKFWPGQKVIISTTGNLSIDSSILTNRQGPNTECPNLTGLWDGIYIEGWGNPNSTLPKLEMKNNSVLEFSKNGIKAEGSFGRVQITKSTLQNNLSLINVGNEHPVNGYAGWIYLTNSELFVGSSGLSYESLPKVQIRFFGGQLILDDSKVINPNTQTINSELTGIRSARSRLYVENGSRIENFHIGIDKAADPYIAYPFKPGGLFITNSSVLNSDYSIMNTSQFVYAYGNYLEGDIVSEGLCYSRWLSNNINAEYFTMHSPAQSNRIQENLFESLNMEFYGLNGLSYSLCNTWNNANSNIAFIGQNLDSLLTLPVSWGLRDTSSGNRHLDEDNPSLLAGEKLINYFFQVNLSERFTYDPINSLLEGFPATNNHNCNYDYPSIPPVPFNSNEEQYNFVDLNNIWIELDSIKNQKESDLPNASPGTIPHLLEDLSYIRFQMSDIVGKVLMNLEESDSLIAATWLARAHPGIIEFTNLINKWYSKDFAGIENHLDTINNIDAETLQAACEYVQNALGTMRNLGSLTEHELDTLSQIASTSFGDYSNIVRDYLRVEYDIDIPWPVERSIITTRESKTISHEEEHTKKSIFLIMDNPSNGCFTINSSDNRVAIADMRIFDLNGKQLNSSIIQLDSRVCLNELARGIYFLNISNKLFNISETHKLIIN